MAEQSSTVPPLLAGIRTEYRQRSLSERDVDADPLRQFAVWMNEALSAEVHEPTAMTLATSTPEGIPSARIVLLKGADDHRLVFFTNYSSRKGAELERNPQVALVLHWPELERQVRVEGRVARTSAAESDAYFQSRPAASRVGAAASTQSQVISSREVLEAQVQRVLAQYPDGNVPRPDNWGGYEVRPTRFEYWQGRPSRLHDRIEYVLDASSRWIIRRLSP